MKLAKKFGASVYALAPSGKRGAIVVLSEYRQRHHRKFVAKESGRPYSPPQVVDITGAPGMIRTCDPLIRSLNHLLFSRFPQYQKVPIR
jgi:hypothetical protein